MLQKRKNENEVYNNLHDKRKKQKPKYKLGDLVRTADERNIFSKGDNPQIGVINYIQLQKLLMIQFQVIISTIYQNVYNEALLKKTKLSFDENDFVINKLENKKLIIYICKR